MLKLCQYGFPHDHPKTRRRRETAYFGSMTSISEPDELATNSLLMKSPRGCSYDLPLGSVIDVDKEEDIVSATVMQPYSRMVKSS